MAARKTPVSTPSAPARQRRATNRGSATRDRILDAAEELFAERGFAGTSMRDIATAAPAELGSISYHFQSKEDIFSKVLARRSEVSAANLGGALDAAIEAAAGNPTPETILGAFADVCFRPFTHGEEDGTVYYSRLVMQRIPVENDGHLHSAIAEHYLPVRRRFVAALQKALPTVPASEIDWAFSLYEASFGSVLFSSTQKSFALKQATPAALEQLRSNLVGFCAAGFHHIEQNAALAQPRKKSSARSATAAPGKARVRKTG